MRHHSPYIALASENPHSTVHRPLGRDCSSDTPSCRPITKHQAIVRTQIVHIGKAAWNDDDITVFKIVRFVPEKRNRLLGYVLDGPVRVVIAVGPREDDDTKFHLFLGDGDAFKSSMSQNFRLPLLNTQHELHTTTSPSGLWAQAVVAEEAVPPQDPRRVVVPCDKKFCHQKHRLHREQTLTASIDRARGAYANPGSSK